MENWIHGARGRGFALPWGLRVDRAGAWSLTSCELEKRMETRNVKWLAHYPGRGTSVSVLANYIGGDGYRVSGSLCAIAKIFKFRTRNRYNLLLAYLVSESDRPQEINNGPERACANDRAGRTTLESEPNCSTAQPEKSPGWDTYHGRLRVCTLYGLCILLQGWHPNSGSAPRALAEVGFFTFLLVTLLGQGSHQNMSQDSIFL